MSTQLRVDDAVVRYGDVAAVDGVSISVAAGRIVALLGANGAGKSSLVAAVSGLVPLAGGSISVGDADLARLRREQRARHVAHVPEGRRLFPEHTVRENLLLAAYRTHGADRTTRLARVLDIFPTLSALLRRRAATLSGGEQQMVALGRGLMSGAPILAIDELSLGLAPIVVSAFAETLRELRDQGLGILLVEQYAALALSIADEAVVMERGRVVLQGTAREMQDDVLALQAAYLGTGIDNRPAEVDGARRVGRGRGYPSAPRRHAGRVSDGPA